MQGRPAGDPPPLGHHIAAEYVLRVNEVFDPREPRSSEQADAKIAGPGVLQPPSRWLGQMQVDARTPGIDMDAAVRRPAHPIRPWNRSTVEFCRRVGRLIKRRTVGRPWRVPDPGHVRTSISRHPDPPPNGLRRESFRPSWPTLSQANAPSMRRRRIRRPG